MTLTFTLTDTEYTAVMDSLHEAVIAFGGYRTRSNRERSVHALELEHLRTLLAEAAAPPKPRSIKGCRECDSVLQSGYSGDSTRCTCGPPENEDS
jgi:hypothetical protein